MANPRDAAAWRWHDLLNALLTILNTPNTVAQRQAWREYVTLVLLYAWVGFTLLDNRRQSWRWWQWSRWRPRRRTDTPTQKRDALLAVYIWLDIVQQRKAGTLAACAGIRLVQERPADVVGQR